MVPAWHVPMVATSGTLLGMSDENLRMTFVAERSALDVTCIACGVVWTFGFSDLRWCPPSAIASRAAHDCAGPAPIWEPPAVTSDTVGIERTRSFVETHMIRSGAGVVVLSDVLERYAQVTGEWVDSGRFSRRLRAVLPPGAGIARGMVNGVRARRVFGMALRDTP
jgi:hypothetical protein